MGSLQELMGDYRTPWTKTNDHGRLSGRPWQRLRDAVLTRDLYTCRACGRVAVMGMEVDHIVPLCKGGTNAMSNLQALCRVPCHQNKTARDAGVTRRVAIGVDGWPL